jgi:hypothetical protein
VAQRHDLVDDEIRPVNAEWALETSDSPDEAGFSSWIAITVECAPVVIAADDSDYDADESDEDSFGDDDSDEESGEELSISIDAVPGSVVDWRSLAGHHLVGTSFGEQGEAVVTFGNHYRYDRVVIDIPEQRNKTADFHITLSGDLDGLGLDEIELTVSGEYTGM